ncbi:MAG: hypothetical protein A3E78_12160 [Alphaproteobacteria bacterium RIFCSPHIGHO2_12_FULL_63_12]|nr:MAG: hypothetical protein A3E78_12160 [Alphaproteobacteria bacterium RIFCSPHIGHO2_12_FULL_63_12]
MARGTTLGQLVAQLKAEIGMSASAAVGQEKIGQLQQLLRRHQELLYDTYTWPHLRVRHADKATAAGQRFYDWPAAINPDRVDGAVFRWGSLWQPVTFGIDTEIDYNQFDSGEDVRSDPVLKWDWYDDGGSLQFEVWPMPATVSTIRFSGIKALGSLTADADTADLDDRLIVLFAAAEMRAGQKDEDTKKQLASARLTRLGINAIKSGPVVIGGGEADLRRRRPLTIQIAASSS